MNIDEQFFSVDDWHEVVGSEQSVPAAVTIMLEEVQELEDAVANEDRILIADALGDILVTLYGVVRSVYIEAAEQDMNMDAIFTEIMDSNWSKFVLDENDNQVAIRREDGKIMKGPYYIEPDLAKVIDTNG